jgi:membrane protease YdiL (CAAX protease family)
MAISRRLAWAILLAAVVTAGLLRQFHAAIPSSPFLPAPFGSLLFFLIVILFLVFAKGWGRRQEIPYAGEGLGRVNFLALLPLLIALMLEKWVSITIYGPLFSAINGTRLRADLHNVLYLIESATGLLIVSVALLPLFRRLLPLLRKFLRPRRIPFAGASIGFALLVLYGGLWAFFRVFSSGGAGGIHLRWLGFGRYTGLVLLAQGLIAFAEELYYRGILQTELAFLLPALGVTRQRTRLALAAGLISIAFALEHFVGSGTGGDVRRMVFTLTCSLLLGVLLILADNLWLCAGCHFIVDVLVLPSGRAAPSGLQFVDGAGRILLDPSLYVSVFFSLIFVCAYARMGIGVALRKRGPLGAALAKGLA